MQTRGLVLAALLLVGLGGAIWWTGREPKPQDLKLPPEKTKNLMTLLEADLVEIQVDKRGEESKVLARDPATRKWILQSEKAKDPKFPTDFDTATLLANNSSTLPAEKTVDENAPDLIQYGLDPPQIVLTVKDKNGKTDKVHFGDDAPVGQLVYAAKPGTRKVYAIAKYMRDAVAKSVEELRDKRLLLVDEPKVSKLEFIRAKEKIEFSKNSRSEWQVAQPDAMRADVVAVSELLSKALTIKYSSRPSPEEAKKSLSNFAGATPVATLRATDPAGTQELEIRKTKDNAYLAKSNSAPGAHAIMEDLGATFEKSPADFRNKKLFEFGHEDVSRVEIKNNGKATLLEKKGEDWFLNSKKSPGPTVQPVLDQLRLMQAMKFAKGVMTAPVVEISVATQSTKKPEKLLISKKGNFVYAQREGEATEFELDPKVLSDLESAIAAIQPSDGKK